MSNKVKIVEYKENWSEYTLENGAIIRLKPVVTDIILKDKKKDDGSPIYSVSFQPIITYDKKK